MSKIIILRGPYCSGKTTWAKKYCTKHKNSIRISQKELLSILSGEKPNSNLIEIVKQIQFDVISQAIIEGLDLIIDDEHITQKSLDYVDDTISDIALSLINQGIVPDFNVEIKEFKTPIHICLRRNRKSLTPRKEKLIVKSYLYIRKHR